MESLSADFIKELLSESDRDTRLPVRRQPEPESWNSFEGEVLDCKVCGCCETPEECTQSITCPKCQSSPSTLCTEGKRLVGFHQERVDSAIKHRGAK